MHLMHYLLVTIDPAASAVDFISSLAREVTDVVFVHFFLFFFFLTRYCKERYRTTKNVISQYVRNTKVSN